MAITRPQLHDAIVQTKEYIDKNVNELQDKIYSRGGYVIVDSLPVQNVKIDKTYLVPKVDSNGYAISGSYLEYIYAARYNSGTTITDGLIDFIYEKFIKLIPNSGNYAFIYNGTIWEYDNQEVILSDYGITILDGIPVENDTITISVSNGSWEPVGDATLDLSNYYNKTEIDAKETTINNSIAITNANIAKKENIFRYENMIMPHSGLANKIIQYVGESGTFTQPNFSINLVKGYYYKCVIDPNNNSFTKSGRSWDGGDYSSYDLSFEQEFTVSVYIKRVYVYIDNVGLYTGLYDTINGRRNYDGTTVTFTLPAGSVLSFRSSGQNDAQVSNLTFTGTLYKWEQHNVQPNGTTINSLNDINNVDISEPEDNQIIAYNEETEKWENKTINVNPSSIIDDAITSVNNTWSANKISENLNNKQDKAQYSIMPTPSAKYLNKTIQYVGTTDDNYINSYFYKCVSDGESTPTYSWVESPTFSIDGYEAGDGIDITDGTISTDNMPATDMSEVASPMPSVMSRRFKYSTEEQIVGEWIDGKRLYQKTLTFDPTVTIPENTWTELADISSLSVDKLIFASAHGGNGQENPSIINVDNDKLRGFNYKGSIGLIEAIIIQYTKTTD